MAFLVAIEQSALGVWIRETPSVFAFPFILFLHTLGLGIVVGVNVAINVWALGFAKRYPIGPLQQLMPVMWIGFAINAVSGVLLLVAYPAKALTNPIFYIKLGLIAVAVVALAWLGRQVFAGADPGRVFEPGIRVKSVAATTLALWAGTIATGRFLAYTHSILMAGDVVN